MCRRTGYKYAINKIYKIAHRVYVLCNMYGRQKDLSLPKTFDTETLRPFLEDQLNNQVEWFEQRADLWLGLICMEA